MKSVALKILYSLILIWIKEGNSEIFPCNSTTELLFQCSDGKTCIKRDTFCNGNSSCPDGSDELTFNESKSEENGIECQYDRTKLIDKKCHLAKQYLCDHEMDCIGGRDECDCPHTFHCDDGDCAVKVTFCDGTDQCADGTDEKKYNRTTKAGFQCPVTGTHETNNCLLPDRYVCDGESDCDNGIDECFCDFSSGQKKGVYLNESFSNEKCFRCLDGLLVIPNTKVCDGIVHCQDLSDECLCTNRKNYTTLTICSLICDGTNCNCKGEIECIRQNSGSNAKSCIPSNLICDNIIDCENGIDEKYCSENDQLFQCYDNKTKIAKSKLCNGPRDCEDGSDEDFCAEQFNYYCKYWRGYFPAVEDWDNKTETSERVQIPPGFVLKKDYSFYTEQCDGVPMCGELDDECYAPQCVNDRPGFCKFVAGFGEPFRCPVSGSFIIGVEICDGKPTCNDTHPHLSEDELFCPNRFYCSNKGATRRPIHIPESGQCNGIQECDDQSDEIGCPNTTHFYCNDTGSKKFLLNSEVCDGTKDCEGGSDECQEYCNPSPFSSHQKLISSRVLVVFLWIIGLVAVIGNFLVIVHQLKSLIRPGGSTVARCNKMLVLSLSMADILVGMYLVILGVKDATTDEYCQLDNEWRSGSTCSALGALALVGTETSVFMLLIMTAYRLYLVIQPFKTQKTIVVKIAVGVAWFLALLLALLPFSSSMSDYFVSCVWYRNNEFFGLICNKDLKAFTMELSKRGEESGRFVDSLKGGYTWENMFAAVKEINSSYVPERYFGYYSAHSVCLPRLFPNPDEDRSWGYSLFLILLNFLAFIFILISYIYIYRQTTKRTTASKASSEDRSAALQRKVTRIVATDFCCWMPICIMAFMKVSGVDVSDVAYAVTAIILLPINAAMNPFLYSDVLDYVWEKMMPARIWFQATSLGKGLEKIHQAGISSESGITGSTSAPTTPAHALSQQSPGHTTDGKKTIESEM